MRRHGRALGLLLTSAAVVAVGLVAAPAGPVGAADASPQVVYIDAGGHLMVGALDGSDTPRALAPGMTTYRAWVSPSGSTLTGTFASNGTYAVVLRNRYTTNTTILSTKGTWIMRTWDVGTSLFLDSGGGIYDVSRGGVVMRRDVRGPSEGVESEERMQERALSPSADLLAFWWTSSYCEQGLVVLQLRYEASTSRGFPEGNCGHPRGQVLGWVDDFTVLYAFPAVESVDDPQQSIVYTLRMWPEVEATPTDTGLRGITRIEHWGTQWWFWRAGGSEYGVSASATEEPATWLPLPAGMTIVGPVSADPPVLGTAVNRSSSEAHLSIQPTTVPVRQSPSILGYARYAVTPPGWRPDTDVGSYLDDTGGGVLYGSTDVGRTWRVLARTSSLDPFPISPITRNLWLRWRHPADAFSTSDVSIVRKVTARPVIDATNYGLNGSTKVSGTVTRINGSARLQRWSGSAWVLVATTTVSATGKFSFGWRTLRHAKYRVYVPATTYWGASSQTLYL